MPCASYLSQGRSRTACVPRHDRSAVSACFCITRRLSGRINSTQILPDGPAAEMGQERGNVIKSMNQRTVKTAAEVQRIVKDSTSGHVLLLVKGKAGYHFGGLRGLSVRRAAHRNRATSAADLECQPAGILRRIVRQVADRVSSMT